MCSRIGNHSRKLSLDLHSPADVPHQQSIAKWLILRQTSKSEIMWEVLSNEDPETQVRTIELSELSLFQHSSMLTPGDVQPIFDQLHSFRPHEVHSFCFARLASRSSHMSFQNTGAETRKSSQCFEPAETRESSPCSEPGDVNKSITISKTAFLKMSSFTPY